MQNEILTAKSLVLPEIRWRVYYGEQGQIIACSPTLIHELQSCPYILISHDLGNQFVKGNKRVEDYKIIQSGGGPHLVEVASISSRLEPRAGYEGSLKYFQIKHVNDATYYVSIASNREESLIIFQVNQMFKNKLAQELENVTSAIRFYFTKKNDPTWLYWTIDIDPKELLEKGKIEKYVGNITEFSVFTKEYINGFRLHTDKSNKPNDEVFYDFINGFESFQPVKLVPTHLRNPIIDITFKGRQMFVKLGNEYRDYLIKYISTPNAKTQTNLYVVDRAFPFSLLHKVNLDLADLTIRDVCFEIETENPIIYADIVNPHQFIRLEQRKDLYFKRFISSLGSPKSYILNPLDSSDYVIGITIKNNTKMRVNLNYIYRPYLRKYLSLVSNPKPIKLTISSSTINMYVIQLEKLLSSDIDIDVEIDGQPMIYIDVDDSKHYFQTKMD